MDRHQNGLGSALGTQLGQDVADMGLDGGLRDLEPLHDLPIGAPLSQQLYHLPFALTEGIMMA